MGRKETITEGVTLYLGDCREILPTLGAVQIVSDPPYGINFVHSGKDGPASRLQGGSTVHKAPAPIIGDNHEFDPAALLKHDCVLFGANHYHLKLPAGGAFHVWDKHCGRGGNDSFSDAELIWTNKKSKTRVVRHLWKGILRDGESHSGPKLHPSQKPIAVMSWCIKTFADGNALICDPYMGSGTTGVAACNLQHDFVGIEIEPSYFDIACKRIDAAARQSLLPFGEGDDHRQRGGAAVSDQFAINGTIWVCGACGKTSKDRYGDGKSSWDESCMLNAILCYAEKRPDEHGLFLWTAVTPTLSSPVGKGEA